MSSTLSDKAPKPKSRLDDIDAMRGVLIVLVVFGHITLHSYPTGNDWYELARSVVYRFHMPAFLFVSGFVYFHVGKQQTAWRDIGRFTANRAERLLLPYLLMAFLIIVGKIVVSHFLPVDQVPKNIFTGLLAAFGPTEDNPINALWYLMVLFIFSAATPLIYSFVGGKLELIFTVALALHILGYTLDLPEEFYIAKCARYYVFFLAGGLAVRYADTYLHLIDRYRSYFMIAAAGTLLLTAFNLYSVFTMIIASSVMIPAIHALCRSAVVNRQQSVQTLSRYSMSIYLFNSSCSGLLKGLILRFSTWNGHAFLFWAPLMVVFGLITPIAVKTLVLDRVAYLRRLTT